MSDHDPEMSLGDVTDRLPKRCPKCRTTLDNDQGRCQRCGWSSLRSSEIVFLDSTFLCPQCNAERVPWNDRCEQCGSEAVLHPGLRTSYFTINSLLAVTTLIASCVALCVSLPLVGIPASLLSGLALTRTAILIRRRRRQGYPVRSEDHWRFFAQAGVALFLASLAAGVVTFVAGACLMAIGAVISFEYEAVLLLGVVTMIAVIIPLIVMKAHNSSWSMTPFIFAAAVVQIVALPTFLLPENWVPGNHWIVMPRILLGALAAVLAAGVWFICRDGRKRTVLLLIVGGYLSYTLLGLLSALAGYDERVAVGLLFGLAMLSSLSTMALILTNIWSFDDAFS